MFITTFCSVAEKSPTPADKAADVSIAESEPSVSESAPATNGLVNGVADHPPPSSGDFKIKRDLEGQIANAGDNVTLECHFEGSAWRLIHKVQYNINFLGEPSDVMWSRNGKEIKPSASAQINADGAKHTLALSNTTAEDSGVYQCEARGSVASCASVLVACKIKFSYVWHFKQNFRKFLKFLKYIFLYLHTFQLRTSRPVRRLSNFLNRWQSPPVAPPNLPSNLKILPDWLVRGT